MPRRYPDSEFDWSMFAGMPVRRVRKPRAADGLYDLRGAAERLNVTADQLRAFVASGQLKFINVGLGAKRPRYRFAEGDLAELISKLTSQESAPCPSSKPRRVRRTSGTTSNSVVIDFMAQLDAHLAKKH